MSAVTYDKGDMVVYRMPKRSERPGPRAEEVTPAQHGETYSYVVEKFWRVGRVCEDGKLVLVTRTGKTHLVSADDFHLRKAGALERLFYRGRFPSDEIVASQQDDKAP